MLTSVVRRFGLTGAAAFALLFVFASAQKTVSAQGRFPDIGRVADAVGVKVKVGEVTLEAIDFRDQTARLNIGLDVANGLVPVSLKDFDYALRLGDRDLIEGRHAGALKVGGRRTSRVNLPVTVHLRSIPGVVWSAFSNRGRLSYDLETAFTLPLFVTERRFDQSFSGEVPLRSVVDAALILRARGLSEGRTPSRNRPSIWDVLQ